MDTTRITTTRDADVVILSLAARQHGVVARWQLVRAGVPVTLVENRLKRQRMQRLHRCVYRVAPLAGPRAAEVAAALSYGVAAVVSHGSAAAVYDLVPRPVVIAVSVPRGHPKARPGIRLYRVLLHPSETTCHDGVHVTAPARTLLDFATVAASRELEQAVARALRQELVAETELRELLDRYLRRSGARELRALLSQEAPPCLTRSEAEELFLALIRRAGLPAPLTNTRTAGYEVDFFWCAANLVVEIDGLAYHSSRRAMARDRQRDAVLTAAGMRVMRFTWSDLTDRPEATVARVAQALARHPADPARESWSGSHA